MKNCCHWPQKHCFSLDWPIREVPSRQRKIKRGIRLPNIARKLAKFELKGTAAFWANWNGHEKCFSNISDSIDVSFAQAHDILLLKLLLLACSVQSEKTFIRSCQIIEWLNARNYITSRINRNELSWHITRHGFFSSQRQISTLTRVYNNDYKSQTSPMSWVYFDSMITCTKIKIVS